ncbi:MAG: CHAP domain-containing protein, partial [Oscillospiraceae bacterium]|nr:CHAP domain-containing protein [Oscillospiraceae bacterium]
EGNTSAGNDANGGQVQRRTRPGKYIMGAVRPGFDKEESEMTQEEFNKKFEAALSAHRQKLQDNDASSYSAEARAWAVARGLVQGGGKLPDGTDNFMWEDLLTREQMATLLYRFALLMGQA